MSQTSAPLLEYGSSSNKAPTGPPGRTRPSLLTWLGRVLLVVIVAVIGIFVWGYFQPKPEGFDPTDPDEGAFTTEQWTRYTVDATSETDWVFFDFDRGRVLPATLTSPEWDLGFKRTDLVTNSGATNPDGIGGAVDLGEIPLELAVAPTSVELVRDGLGGDDGDELDNPEISDWYNYTFTTHTIHAKANTYLVRASDSRDALVQFDSYYCDNEDPGCVTFRYRLISAVDSP